MISRVYLKNWKSHHETELTFSDGVNVLVGEMGSGKSSVVEAILFGLYGTTPALQSRKVTLDQVMRRSPSRANECVIEVDVERDGATYTVRREIVRDGDRAKTDTSELRKDGELIEAPQTSAVTEKIEQILGIDYELFSRSIYSEQNQLDYFLTLRAGERKEKVDELLELDRFEAARKTLVSVINRLEDRRKTRESDLESLQEDIDEAEIGALREKQDAAREQLKELREQLHELKEKNEDINEQFKAVQEKKERFEELKQKRTALKTRLQSIQEQIEKLRTEAEDAADLSEDAVVERREALQEEKQELQETQEEITELEKQVSVLEERREQHKEQLTELKKQVEQAEKLGEIKETLEEKENKLEQEKKQLQEYRTRLEDVKKSLQKLSKASETCPTCGQELTEDHRVEFLQQRKTEQAELEDKIKNTKETQEELAKTVAELEEEKEELLQYKDAEEKLGETEEALETLKEKIDDKTDQLEELQDTYADDRLEELEEQEDVLDTVEELLELQEEKAERQDQLEEVADELEDLSFDEDRLEELREKRNECEKKREVVKNDVENKEEMLEEREKRLEELEQKQERIEEYEEWIALYREKNDMLNNLLKALERTQIELRQQFIDSVNEMMNDIWQQVYPYDDYTGIRLNAADGYVLELEDGDGNWISVNGEVSGGERHASALTLRIALSILLTPNWRILILDEPTHNLDATAIEELAETLRTQVSDIMGQLFVITHEERLETAVTGDLYRLSKKQAETGTTQVDPMTGE